MALATKVLKAIRNPNLILMRLNRPFAERAKAVDLVALRSELLDFLSTSFDCDARALWSEFQTSQFKSDYQRVLDTLGQRVPSLRGVTDTFDCEVLYLLVRACKPSVVVETGVAYGASSAHILAAMEANGHGHLHSIDLPLPHIWPVEHQGALVPEHLRARWELINGDATVELPKLIERLGQIDLFHHDSHHTYEHMLWEYKTALPYIRRPGVLSSHDVVDTLIAPNAFPVVCRLERFEHRVFRNLGIALVR